MPKYTGELVRTFICIEIPQLHREKLAEWINRNRHVTDEIRWVNPKTLHITLKFCGERPPELVEKLKERVAKMKTEGAITLSLSGIGGFPKLEKPRVIWTAVGGETARLANLAAQLEKTAASCGMERAKGAYTPHLTLGRRSEFGALPSNVTERLLADKIELEPWTAAEFVLMKSRLLPSGAEYTPIACFKI